MARNSLLVSCSPPLFFMTFFHPFPPPLFKIAPLAFYSWESGLTTSPFPPRIAIPPLFSTKSFVCYFSQTVSVSSLQRRPSFFFFPPVGYRCLFRLYVSLPFSRHKKTQRSSFPNWRDQKAFLSFPPSNDLDISPPPSPFPSRSYTSCRRTLPGINENFFFSFFLLTLVFLGRDCLFLPLNRLYQPWRRGSISCSLPFTTPPFFLFPPHEKLVSIASALWGQFS